MPILLAALALLSLGFSSFGTIPAAASYRVLVLDIGRWPNKRPGSDQHRLLLLDIDSGKVLARTQLGFNTDLALSPQGDTIAALSDRPAGESGTRLHFYRANNLSLLQGGRFPHSIPRQMYHFGAADSAAADMALSPDEQVLLLCGLEGGGNVDLATTVVTSVKRELDNEGFFGSGTKTVRIPRCRSVDFVSVADWPRIHVLNHTLTLLEVIDLRTGEIRSRLPLGDDPALKTVDPAALDNADFNLILRIRNKGVIVSGGGRYGYYVPYSISDHPGLPRPLPEPGFLKKIDLTADPPKVACQGEKRAPDLRARIAAASESAGALFVLEERRNPHFTREPSRWVKVFNASDLKFQRQIELPLTDCCSLQVSRDGKYLYALDAEEGKLAVLDTATGRQVKVLDKVGTYPYILLALP